MVDRSCAQYIGFESHDGTCDSARWLQLRGITTLHQSTPGRARAENKRKKKWAALSGGKGGGELETISIRINVSP